MWARAAIATTVFALLAVLLVPVFNQARLAAKEDAAMSNMHLLGLASLMYANDNDNHLPPHMESAAAARAYLQKYAEQDAGLDIFTTANPAGGETLGNPRVSGLDLDAIAEPSETVLFYDSEPWHSEYMLACYSDAHYAMTDASKLAAKLKRDPVIKVPPPKKLSVGP
ncbi:MAG TPA: hypothetical protein VG944_15650 [Fimbriimonas sp.]|nr:hypothetical protein [Fimbriimonas sp.]